MIAVSAAILAVTLPVEPEPANECNAAIMMRERAELILNALDKAKQVGAASVESGAGATETIVNFAAARRSELLVPAKSPEWRAWRARWINCATRANGTP